MKFSFHRIHAGICNCYLLRGERTILVDAGAWGGFPSFERAIEHIGVDPHRIELILLTHGHWDHITCLDQIRGMTGAKVAVHFQDQYMIESGEPPFPAGVNGYGRAMSWLSRRLIHPKLPKIKVDKVIGDEGMSLDEYGIPGRVVHAPGHTKGHTAVLLETGDALVGDMAMNDWYLRLTPGLPVLADDFPALVETWKRIIPMGIKRVYPAHGLDFPVEVLQKEIAEIK